jgi:hypothetical protein
MSQHLHYPHRMHPNWSALPHDASLGLVPRGAPPATAGASSIRTPAVLLALPWLVAVVGLVLALAPLA